MYGAHLTTLRNELAKAKCKKQVMITHMTIWGTCWWRTPLDTEFGRWGSLEVTPYHHWPWNVLATTSRLTHVRWYLTGDVMSADEDEGVAEDDYLEFDKQRFRIFAFSWPIPEPNGTPEWQVSASPSKTPPLIRLVCKGVEDLRHFCNIRCRHQRRGPILWTSGCGD